MSQKLPTIAIIGPANAGKSSLFNRLVGYRQAIVAKEAGTTRDNVMARLELDGRSCWLVDTAGFKDPADDFETTIQDQITEATELADVIIVLLDSSLYPSQIETDLVRKAQKSTKPVILALNKSDLKNSLTLDEFYSLGVQHMLKISAAHDRGIDKLVDLIVTNLPSAETQSPAASSTDFKIALIGRPNVGKSFLFNTLAGKQQAVVSNVAGTTRDLNRIQVRYHSQTIELIDTAGVRRPGKQEQGIEKFSVLRTLSAIEEADICLLVIDGTEYATQLDQKLAGMIDEAGRGMVVVVSKSDLIPAEVDKDQMINRTADRLKFAPYAPLIFTSSITGKNVAKIFELATEIMSRRQQKVPTTKLNQILADAKRHHLPAGLKNTNPKPRYIVQTDTNPPWFVVYGSDLGLLHWSWKRYLDRAVREAVDYTGTPIKFSFINSNSKTKPKS